ncbi:MAG: glycosyltransferase family 2 protein [Flavobacteriales bacterium]|nr:glycosyltransferase family 2 protein [Flavobacteriales bacterium]
MISCTTDTAVVILSYNGKPYHEAFLPLIVSESAGKYDVVLIDNASTDDTAAYIKTNFPSVKLIQLPVNLGFTGGYTEGLKHIDTRYVVLLSADFEVTPGWFQPLHRLMESDESIAACQPKVRFQKQRELFEYAGAAGGFIDTLGYPFCRGRIFFTLEEDKNQYNDNRECFWASGGCFFTRKQLFDAFGGFDADFFAHMEEIDLCWRMKNAGYKIMACGESTVFHVGGSVISYGSPQKIFRNYRNGLIMLVKNLPWGQLLWKLPVRLQLDVIAAYKALFSGNLQEFMAILKAHLSFIFGMPKWLGKRKNIKRSNPNSTGIYPRSMVWDYFAKGKKKFSELEF